MNRKSFCLFCILVLIIGFGCGTEKQTNQTVTLTPSRNVNSPTGVYIPKNLEECFLEFKRMLPPDVIKEFKKRDQGNVIRYHLTLGVWIRNNWGLWQGSCLVDYFNQRGIQHPDDMSGIILNSFWRYLNDRPIRLIDQVDLYNEYWKIMKSLCSEVTQVIEITL